MKNKDDRKKHDAEPYDILKKIPHRRVVQQNNTEEIFDLYQLGTFPAKNSLLSTLCSEVSTEQEVNEQVELVELQPAAVYRPHFHEKSSAIIYIIMGTGQFLLNNEFVNYHNAQRIVIPAGVMHGFRTITRTLFLSIQSPPIIDVNSGKIDLHYGECYV